MHLAIVAAFLTVCVGTSLASTATGGHGFCYENSPSCGPRSKEWNGVCQTGRRQSPINLPPALPTGAFTLKTSIYKGNSFRMTNNGHSVQVDFNNQGPSTTTTYLPDPVDLYNLNKTRAYKFASAHFHWGTMDYFTGSEHQVMGQNSAMEIHLVHYLASFKTQAEAIASGDENALAVIGILVDAKIVKTILKFVTGISHPSMAPVVRNLHKCREADHSGKMITVNEPLDLSHLFKRKLLEPTLIYSYKGSLTTPGCNEQVNWYVVKERMTTSMQDIDKFRDTLKDSYGHQMKSNHRGVQPWNGRKIRLSLVKPVA